MRYIRRDFLAATAATLPFAILPARASAAEYTYKLAHDLPTGHPIFVGVNEMAQQILKESNGRLEIRVFPNSQLGGSTSLVTQLRTGALEILMQGVGPLASITPVMNAGFIGFAFMTSKSAIGAMQGDLGDIFRKELEAKGIHAFGSVWEAGLRQMTNSKAPIKTADDLAGLKVRVTTSPITLDMFRTLGASPVAMDLSELYTALQTHVVDSADGPYINLFAQKIYEVQKFISVTNHQWSGYWVLLNSDKWKALPPDLQGILQRNADKYATREQRVAGLQSASIGDLLTRYGMKRNVTDTSGVREKLAGYYGRWKKEFGPVVWAAIEKYSGRLG